MSTKMNPNFTETSWSLLRRATDPEQRTLAAHNLNIFCRRYWYPFYVRARRKGLSPTDAEDLTQEFFAHIVRTNKLAEADCGKGKLRTFLCGIFDGLRIDELRRQNAKKRGGGIDRHFINFTDAEERFSVDSVDSKLNPEQQFARDWAGSVLQNSFEQLILNNLTKREELELLRPLFFVDDDALSRSEAAQRLGTTDANLRKKIQRLKALFSEVLFQEVRAALEDPSDPEVFEEIEGLKDALRSPVANQNLLA